MEALHRSEPLAIKPSVYATFRDRAGFEGATVVQRSGTDGNRGISFGWRSLEDAIP